VLFSVDLKAENVTSLPPQASTADHWVDRDLRPDACRGIALWFYCIGVLLSLAAHLLLSRIGGAVMAQAAVSAAGICFRVLIVSS
jgi:hypothetical protein